MSGDSISVEKQHSKAYVDEAGAKGLLRNLNASTDDEIAVLAALVTPQGSEEHFHNVLLLPFEKFKSARPNGVGTLHITDAFIPGNEEWASVAREVRTELFTKIRELKIPIIYDARRQRVARRSYQVATDLMEKARALRTSIISINHRPSAERIDGACMTGLALKLDALAEDQGLGVIDLITDQMDRSIAELFEEMIEETATISKTKDASVPGWNPVERKKVFGTIRIEIKDKRGQPIQWLDTKHVGDVVVLGKDNPLVFAADVVVNALYHHLKSLSADAPLNAPSSIRGWELAECVYGVRVSAFEDQI